MSFGLCGLLLLGAVGCAVSRESQPFDKAAWARKRTIGMAYDIERRSLVDSMTAEEVTRTLGKPEVADIDGSGGGAFQYDLPYLWYLEVDFLQGKVIDATVVEAAD